MVQLVRSPMVQQELKLQTEQRRVIEKLVRSVEYPLFQLRDWSPDQKRDRCEELSKQVETGLRQTLSNLQQKRLSEIVLRAQGYAALLAPDRVEQLKLTPEQVQNLRKSLTDAKASKSLDEQVQRILKPEQLSELTRLVGAPFAVEQIKPIACRAPELQDVERWINSPPLTMKKLEGQVVAVHYWAFGCINCVRNLPWYKNWHEQFKDKGVTILGIHTPETSAERSAENVEAQVRAREIAYPVAIDGQASNWTAWANNIWPAVYLVDKRGDVRYWWYGELKWQGAKGEELMRHRIEELLAEEG